jgi:hypothetical protein
VADARTGVLTRHHFAQLVPLAQAGLDYLLAQVWMWVFECVERAGRACACCSVQATRGLHWTSAVSLIVVYSRRAK